MTPSIRIIGIAVSPLVELVRWILDHQGYAYVEENHIPVFHAFSTRRAGKTNDVPVVVVAEGSLKNARAATAYFEARARRDKRLVPREQSVEVMKLFDEAYDFGVAARAWAYAYMLPQKATTIRSWSVDAPWWQRMLVPLFYPTIRKLMAKSMSIDDTTIATRGKDIDAALTHIDALLADGRRFLTGDAMTLADVAFAAFATPVIFPPHCRSPLPKVEELPAEMRKSIQQYRERPSGQFVLRMYNEQRPKRATEVPSPNRPSMFAGLTSTKVLRPVLGFFRKHIPVLVFGKKVLTTSHQAVTDVLARDTDFTISQINSPRIDRLDGPFILGMDRSPEYDREEAALRRAVRPEDLEHVRSLVRANAAELIDAARPRLHIDVVNGYARLVAARTVADYFGTPGPDEPTLMRWMRRTFQDVFLNIGNDKRVSGAAAQAGKELLAYENALISALEQNPGDRDDIVTRLVRMEQGWLDHNAVRRNLGGMIVGAVDTTSKFVTLAINQLLDRPKELGEAREAAIANDVERVRHYTYEAIRFDPHNAFLLRYAPKETQLAGKTIKANSAVLISVLSAMFDPDGFPDPQSFRIDRERYLHFGEGLHTCFGLRINAVQIPELMAGLLRLPNLRREEGARGRIAWDGPFPEHLVLQFDAS